MVGLRKVREEATQGFRLGALWEARLLSQALLESEPDKAEHRVEPDPGQGGVGRACPWRLVERWCGDTLW